MGNPIFDDEVPTWFQEICVTAQNVQRVVIRVGTVFDDQYAIAWIQEGADPIDRPAGVTFDQRNPGVAPHYLRNLKVRQIDADQPAVFQMVTKVSERQNAASLVVPDLNNHIRLAFKDDLLINPVVNGTLPGLHA